MFFAPAYRMRKLFWNTGRWIKKHDFPLKALALIVIMVSFVIAMRALPMEGPLQWLHDRVDELDYWAPVVFVLLFIGLTAVMLPGVVLNIASGALFGPFWGGVLTSIGSTSAAAVSFLIGRYLARRWVSRKVRHYPRLEAVYRALGKEGSWKIVAAVRLSHSLPFGLQNFLLGVSPVGFIAYVLTTWLITLPGIFVFAYLGHLAGAAMGSTEAVDTTGPWFWILRIGGVLIAGAAIFYLGRLVFKAVRDAAKWKEAEPKEEKPRSLSAWPWGTVATLATAMVFLTAALWCYFERDSLRQYFS